MNNVGPTARPTMVTPGMSSYANVTGEPCRKALNFRTLFTMGGNRVDVVVPVESIKAISEMSSYARVMIELRADVELKDTIVVAMPKLTGEGVYTCNIRVEYEWKSPRCACCKVFGHIQEECPKNPGLGVAKNLKMPSQAPRGVSVVLNVGFKPAKEYRLVSKKPTANTSGNKKNGVEPTKEVSNSNPFYVLNSVENDGELGNNGGASNLASNGANPSGSSVWNVETSSTSTTSIVDKIEKLEKLIIDEKATLVDDDGKPLKRVDYLGDHDVRMRDSYENGDYDEDPYDDDMYEGQDIPDKIQYICNNLDIRVRGRKKK
ncbi:hypothetical protein Tco_1484408 [Tanacetum coccineum]